MILFVPVLYTYFGLTAGRTFVLLVVLAALVPWFAALTAAYRFRALDRMLGLDDLPAAPPAGGGVLAPSSDGQVGPAPAR